MSRHAACYDPTIPRHSTSAKGVQPLSPEGSGPSFDFDAQPRAFGSFQVEAALGTGRFGPVFLARDAASGSQVVIRTFADPLSEEQRRELLEALHGLCELPLDHPSVARPLAAGVEADIPYLAHAYLDGLPADEFVATEGPQRLADLAPRLTQAAAAIDFAAAAGVHHGALSLRDVIIGRAGTGVSGFGLFQALGHTVERADDVQALASLALRLLDPADYPLVRQVVAHPPSTALAFAAAFQQAGITRVPQSVADHAELIASIADDEDALDFVPLHAANVDDRLAADVVPLHLDAAGPPLVDAVESERIAREPIETERSGGVSAAAKTWASQEPSYDPPPPPPQREAPRPEVRFGATLDETPEESTSWLGRLAVAVSVVLVASAVFAFGYVMGRRDVVSPAPIVAPQPEPAATKGQTYTDEGIRGQGSGIRAGSGIRDEGTDSGTGIRAADGNQAPRTPAVDATPRPAARTVEKPRPATTEARVAPVPTGPATLFVDSHPSGAQVFVDGAAVGRTPLLMNDVRPGEHRVRLSMPMRRVWQTSVDVAAGVRTRVAASLEELQ